MAPSGRYLTGNSTIIVLCGETWKRAGIALEATQIQRSCRICMRRKGQPLCTNCGACLHWLSTIPAHGHCCSLATALGLSRYFMPLGHTAWLLRVKFQLFCSSLTLMYGLIRKPLRILPRYPTFLPPPLRTGGYALCSRARCLKHTWKAIGLPGGHGLIINGPLRQIGH
jgi:hypothetical protein